MDIISFMIVSHLFVKETRAPREATDVWLVTNQLYHCKNVFSAL